MGPDRRALDDLENLKQAHAWTDALLAAYLAANHGAQPSKTSIIDLMGWSLRRQKQLKSLAKTST